MPRIHRWGVAEAVLARPQASPRPFTIPRNCPPHTPADNGTHSGLSLLIPVMAPQLSGVVPAFQRVQDHQRVGHCM